MMRLTVEYKGKYGREKSFHVTTNLTVGGPFHTVSLLLSVCMSVSVCLLPYHWRHFFVAACDWQLSLAVVFWKAVESRSRKALHGHFFFPSALVYAPFSSQRVLARIGCGDGRAFLRASSSSYSCHLIA